MDHNAIDSGLMDVVPSVTVHEEKYEKNPRTARDKIAKSIVHTLASFMDFFFQERYCHRAVVLETIAAVPGMVGGLLQHLKSLRHIKSDRGWIKTLLDEAENERMHLLVYNAISKPSSGERFGIMVMQFFFYHLYFLLYLISPGTAHRVVGYFEEEAIRSYEHYLRLVEEGKHENVEAPQIAIDYWRLPDNARLSDVIKATIKDEMLHRDINHRFAEDATGTKLWN
jgi:ubiquinol oxidase